MRIDIEKKSIKIAYRFRFAIIKKTGECNTMKEENDAKKEEMLQIIDDLEEKIQDLKGLVGEEIPEKKQKYLRRIRVIEAMENENGVVDQERYYQILQEAGMSPQGGSGFMVGDNPSLVYIAGKKVALTENGRKKIKKWSRKAGKL